MFKGTLSRALLGFSMVIAIGLELYSCSSQREEVYEQAQKTAERIVLSKKAYAAPVVPASKAQMQMSFAPLVKKVAPAVVNIYTKRIVEQRAAHPFLDDPFFGQLFNQRGLGGLMRKRVESSLGSGVIIEENGLIVTNAHVIEGAQEITVVLSDGREFEAALALQDTGSDLALLRIQPEGDEALPVAKLRPSENLEVGDLVLAIGNPFGVGQTVTSGIISAQGRSALDINDYNFFIQTDAAINPGNSGGPLVAMDGGVVGINTAIFSRNGGSMGLGFAVPSEMVASVIAAEKTSDGQSKRVVRPWFGIQGQQVTAEIAQSLGFDAPKGALITHLHPQSPLKKAGMSVGDVIYAINGKTVRDVGELKFRMATMAFGQEAEVTYLRNNEETTVSIKAISPPEEPPRQETLLSGQHHLNGATVANINPAVAMELDLSLDQGVIVFKVEPRSPATRIFRPGDVLQNINGIEIKTIGDVKRGVQKAEQMRGMSATFNRNGRVQKITIR